MWAHDVRFLDKMKRPDIIKEGDSVIGAVTQIAQGNHLELEITTESGQLFRGVLPWNKMATMAETKRGEVVIGQMLPAYVTKAPQESPTGRALMSFDKPTAAVSHNASAD